MHDTGCIGALGAYTYSGGEPGLLGAGAVTGCSGRTEKPSFVMTFLQVGGSVVRSSRWGRRRIARVLQVSCAVHGAHLPKFLTTLPLPCAMNDRNSLEEQEQDAPAVCDE